MDKFVVELSKFPIWIIPILRLAWRTCGIEWSVHAVVASKRAFISDGGISSVGPSEGAARWRAPHKGDTSGGNAKRLKYALDDPSML